MVGYTTMGTADLDRAIGFFDALLGEFGGKQIFNTGRLVMWGKQMGDGMFAICTPYDGNAPTVGNGAMVAFNMATREEVDRFHAKALELGATDEGAPGERMPGAYFAYFRDLDGNKFGTFKFGA